MRRLLVVFAFLLIATPALAPTEGYRLRFYNAGAATHLTEVTFPVAQTTCNQTPPPAGTTVNPSFVIWDDEVNVGKVCIWDGSTALLAIPPVGSFEATLASQIGAEFSPESNKAPFSRA